ncbi:hypothetical protein SISNIDRAFT_514546 [Sistotremastrum niveocremeum HHB9708]|uniref:Protein SQS1 n=1 Tax=Sistotremastrum niveocremeum HHB9708 TaxID=1314777 RepID=A0A165A590_9AGAM|nr:hypothetical protein SISNIDRAFT_514546 [Sistotremastrum niveocremeum HHB9708]
MPGNYRGGRGFSQGDGNQVPRGRGRGRGRARGRGRGRGRGGGSPGPFRAGQQNDVDFEGDFGDFTLFASQFEEPARPRQSTGSPSARRFNGTNRGSPSTFRGRGGGLGFGSPPRQTRFQAEALKELERTRPLLKPVLFVPAVHHRILFQQVEEILQSNDSAPLEPHDTPLSAVERVGAVFNQFSIPHPRPEEEKSIQLPEISVVHTRAVELTETTDSPQQGPIHNLPPATLILRSDSSEELSSSFKATEDDVIVYEAPMPRSGSPYESASPKDATAVATEARPRVPTPPSIDSLTFSFQHTLKLGSTTPLQKRKTPKKDRRLARLHQSSGCSSFGFMGAMLQERQMHADGLDTPTEQEQPNDMDLDSDVDEATYANMLNNLINFDGVNQTTMDDIADEEIMLKEDQENSAASSDEGQGLIEALTSIYDQQALKDEESSSESESDEEDGSDASSLDPASSFGARLAEVRSRGASKTKEPSKPDGDDSEHHRESGDASPRKLSDIDAYLDGANFSSLGRKDKKRLLKSIVSGDFMDYDEFEELYSENDHSVKQKDIPPHLQQQWEKDRQAKAKRKEDRRQAKLEQEFSTFLSPRKGGKKREKFRATNLTLLTDGKAVDMKKIETEIRDFVLDIGGPRETSLPPMDKASRAKIHQLALAFNLKSKSHNKGASRFTTLIKTTKTGIGIDERKIRKLTGGRVEMNGSNKGRVFAGRHRDGDEVGKEAPRIGESNIGFKLLAQMGWGEGDRIGMTGGLADPLTAIIKNTKLGLGAMTPVR